MDFCILLSFSKSQVFQVRKLENALVNRWHRRGLKPPNHGLLSEANQCTIVPSSWETFVNSKKEDQRFIPSTNLATSVETLSLNLCTWAEICIKPGSNWCFIVVDHIHHETISNLLNMCLTLNDNCASI